MQLWETIIKVTKYGNEPHARQRVETWSWGEGLDSWSWLDFFSQWQAEISVYREKIQIFLSLILCLFVVEKLKAKGHLSYFACLQSMAQDLSFHAMHKHKHILQIQREKQCVTQEQVYHQAYVYLQHLKNWVRQKIKTLRNAKICYQRFYNICHLITKNDIKLIQYPY